MPLVTAIATQPPAEAQTFEDRWGTISAAVLTSWQRGLQLRSEPGWADAVAQALAGELPVLPWRGGVDSEARAGMDRIGTVQYLAMWQGMRGEDLQVDTAAKVPLTCCRTGVRVTFQVSKGEDPAEAAAPLQPVAPSVSAGRSSSPAPLVMPEPVEAVSHGVGDIDVEQPGESLSQGALF